MSAAEHNRLGLFFWRFDVTWTHPVRTKFDEFEI
jgi:hypothetical protein